MNFFFLETDILKMRHAMTDELVITLHVYYAIHVHDIEWIDEYPTYLCA